MERNEKAERHDHKHRGKGTEGLLNIEAIMKTLDIKRGQTILDAGCGNGYMSKIFSKEVSQSGKVYAMDPNTDAIEALKRETKGTNIDAIAGDITAPTRINPSSVDLVYTSTVVHGFSQEQLSGFIREAKRLLKPDALLAIVEIEKKETPFGPPLNIRFSPEELKKAIPMVARGTVPVGEHFYMQMFRDR